MAGGNASLDPGGDARRPDNARAHWRYAGAKPSCRARVQSRSERPALGQAEAGKKSMRSGIGVCALSARLFNFEIFDVRKGHFSQ